ncbi:DUF2975 domain-containing protein [Demequina gelatinilytica]|uniref:DUF2975 domain-containing protein n=1 Tax=Demequina gelatinilytica TaxID=1638980 RepID=UPI00078582AD|nr:DUF2975 domain-containing protein [Demequina gelatinilytica]
MRSVVIAWLRLLLVGILAGSLLGQVLVVLIAQANGKEAPEVEHLVVPYSIAGIAAILCFQIAVACIWALLTMVESGRIYTARALRWVEAIIWCGGTAAGIVVATAGHLLLFERLGGPGVPLGMMVAMVTGSAFVLLMVVMRGLLATAIADRAELAEVI